MVVFEDLNAFLQTYQDLTKKFPENPVSKNAFLTVCRLIDNSKDIEDINSLCPYGGIIGPGNSCLNNYLYFSKIIRVHAIFHDAFGFMKTTYDTCYQIYQIIFFSVILVELPTGLLLKLSIQIFSTNYLSDDNI